MSNPGGEEELDLEAMGKEIDGGEPVTDEATETPAATETQGQTQETDAKAPKGVSGEEIEVAGRKYPNLEAFKRSHDHLYRHSSKLEQELAKERKWGSTYKNLEKAWKADPEHFNALKKAEEAYFAAKQAGATNKEANVEAKAALSQVPPEIRQQLRELAEWKQSMQARTNAEEFKAAETSLSSEFSELRAKHKTDEATEDACRVIMLEKAERNGIKLTAEDAYEIHLVRQNRMARAELERTRAQADTGTSTGAPPGKTSKKKLEDMTDDEAFADLNAQLGNQGIKD